MFDSGNTVPLFANPPPSPPFPFISFHISLLAFHFLSENALYIALLLLLLDFIILNWTWIWFVELWTELQLDQY